MLNEMTPKIEAVQKMQDYIAAHQTEEINLSDLANTACYSPWYCYRIFKELTGMSVSDYVRRLKLTGAARRLKESDAKVIEVALDSGFESVDGFQRAFYEATEKVPITAFLSIFSVTLFKNYRKRTLKILRSEVFQWHPFYREFGCNPGTYSTHPIPVPYFIPNGVKFQNRHFNACKENEMETRNVFIQVIKKPARKVLIKRGEKAAEYFAYCEEVGCDVWGLLTSMDSLCGEPVCLWLPAELRDGKSEYVQGVEVAPDYKGIIPEGFDVIDLPECDYLML